MVLSPANLRSASGRGDLLRALALAGADPVTESRYGSLLGFEPRSTSTPLEGEDDTAGGARAIRGEHKGDQEQSPEASLQKRSFIFRPYRLVEIENVATDSEWNRPPPPTEPQRRMTLEDQRPWHPAQPIPPGEPIVPWSRLWPRLRQAVAVDRLGGIDVARLSHQIAHGRPVRQIPRRRLQTWPEALTVILDFSDRLTPYWEDWHWLARNLEKRLRSKVRLHRLRGAPPAQLQDQNCKGPIPRWLAWPTPKQHDRLLIASDLGLVDAARLWPSEQWQRALTVIGRARARVVVLAPISECHVDGSLTNAATTVRLSADSSLRPLPRLPPADKVNPQRAPTTDDVRTALPKSAVDLLLAMMSVATVVELPLLRALRRCLPTGGLDAGLEGELWCHPEVDTSATACALAPWAAPRRRQAFQELPQNLQKQTLECLRRWHSGLPQAIHHEETLLWHHLADPAGTEHGHADHARRFFQRVRASLEGSRPEVDDSARRRLLAQFADRHLAWAAPTLGGSEEYISGLSRAVAQLEPERAVAGLPEGVDPVAWLRGLPARSPRSLQLIQDRGQHLVLPVDAESVESDGYIAWLNRSLGLRLAMSDGEMEAGASRLGNVTVSRDAVLWGVSDDADAVVYKPWWLEVKGGSPSAPRLPPRLAMGSEAKSRSRCVWIHTGQQRLRLEATETPPWATVLGQDARGVFAERRTTGKQANRYEWLQPESASPGTILPGLWFRHDFRFESPLPFGIARDACGIFADVNLNGTTQRFRWIQPGSFLMGSPETEAERSDNETRHEVIRTQGFWLADTACTQALWQAVMGDNPGYFKDDMHNPVEQVSWDDVQAFIGRLNESDPTLQVRLPTEAEWEYACRAGTTTPFSFGENITPEQVNYDGNYPYVGGEKGLYRQRTVPVGSLPANPWGLYEMHGNVWEWCRDWYGEYPAALATDPMGPETGAGRVLRGGSWNFLGGLARSSYRYWGEPDNRNNSIGFRLALGLAVSPVEPGGPGAGGRTAAAERGGQGAGDGTGPVKPGGLLNRMKDWFKR